MVLFIDMPFKFRKCLEAILTDYAFSLFFRKCIPCIIQKVSYVLCFVLIEILWDCFRNQETLNDWFQDCRQLIMALNLDFGVQKHLASILLSNFQKPRLGVSNFCNRVNQNFQCMMMDEKNIPSTWHILVRVTEVNYLVH